MRGAAFLVAGVATTTDAEKMHAFEHANRDSLAHTETATMPRLGFTFKPTAVDTLGASSDRVVSSVKQDAQ